MARSSTQQQAAEQPATDTPATEPAADVVQAPGLEPGTAAQPGQYDPDALTAAAATGIQADPERTYSSADADPGSSYTARRDAVVLRHDGSPWQLAQGESVAGEDVGNLAWALVNGDLEPAE